jgi:hypothetical protein
MSAKPAEHHLERECHDLDPDREITVHSHHGGLDIGLSTPVTARIDSNLSEVRLCRPPLSSHFAAWIAWQVFLPTSTNHVPGLKTLVSAAYPDDRTSVLAQSARRSGPRVSGRMEREGFLLERLAS